MPTWGKTVWWPISMRASSIQFEWAPKSSSVCSDFYQLRQIVGGLVRVSVGLHAYPSRYDVPYVPIQLPSTMNYGYMRWK